MNLLAWMFYAGGVVQQWSRGKGAWLSIMWPAYAGQEVVNMLADYRGKKEG